MKQRAWCAIVVAAFFSACGDGAVNWNSSEEVEAGPVEVFDDVTEADLYLAEPDQEKGDLFTHEGADALSDADVEEFEEPGGFGYLCEGDYQCVSGLCVDTGADWRCTITCVEECPQGYSCRNLPAGPDQLEFYCLPDEVRYCRPCQTSKDCRRFTGDDEALCWPLPSGQGSFCTSPCGAAEDCPTSHHCHESGYCAPVGDCDCLAAATNLGHTTDCQNGGEWGACLGERECTPDGLTPCSAPMPTPEVCDGDDNDCDGAVDNGLEVTSCTVENAWGTCPGENVCVEGAIVCAGQTPEQESCDGEDNDCDGLVDETDAVGCETFNLDYDGDGWGGEETVCACHQQSPGLPAGVPLATNALDCDDLDPEVNPTMPEICDSRDNNCDGLIDDGCDKDGDGYCHTIHSSWTPGPVCQHEELDCVDTDATVHPGHEELCDGKANGCDDLLDVNCDKDGDGYCGKPALVWGNAYVCKSHLLDCNDASPAIHPGQPDLCDGVDNNCVEGPDEDCDGDGDGFCAGEPPALVSECYAPSPPSLLICSKVEKACPAFGDCDDNNPQLNPAAPEDCDGLDNDCDGSIDNGVDKDGDGYCAEGVLVTVACKACEGATPDCHDSLATVNPGASDLPDIWALDLDCDGIDGSVDSCVFVDAQNGSDAYAGTMSEPKKTIQAGIDEAAADSGLNCVLVAAGVYYETLTLKPAVHVWGGYDPAAGWQVYPNQTTTIWGDRIAVSAWGLGAATSIGRLEIHSIAPVIKGQSSIGILARNSPGLSVVAVEVFAGKGSSGEHGDDGLDGQPGHDGEDAIDGCLITEILKPWCSYGDNTCPKNASPGQGYGPLTAGGRGQGINTMVATGLWSAPCLSTWDPKWTAEPSARYKLSCHPADGAPGYQINQGAADGIAGGKGCHGYDGHAGAGGAGGHLTQADWTPQWGNPGATGNDGCGGGGGGYGDNTSWNSCDAKGGGGGGGGAGGTGGDGGAAGQGGGGSIAIALYKSGGLVKACKLHTTGGGNGGWGGDGGWGGASGDGGQGGAGYKGSGHGADGGDGGYGGCGGPGGGGAGGISAGVVYTSDSEPTLVGNLHFLGPAGNGGQSGSLSKKGKKPVALQGINPDGEDGIQATVYVSE